MSHSHPETESWKYGIKLQFLIFWSKEQRFTPTLKTREVCENFIKPATEVTQLSYCEQLLLSKHTAGFVGRPSAFISHAWDYHFLEVLEALTSYFASEIDVIVWFDIFSNNQHKTASLEFDWWCYTFRNAIHSFGRTVMVLAPWNDPVPLQRGWCIWELYYTIEGKRSDGNCKFDVAMSPASVEQFIADVDADPVNVIDKMLATVDTSKSKCSKVEDRERIHDAIRRSVGFHELNKEIFEVMRGWVISEYERRHQGLGAQFSPSSLTSMSSLASLFKGQGEYGKALPLFEECLRKSKIVLGENHSDTLRSMNNLASLYHTQGEYGNALPLYEECLQKSKIVLGENHPDTLTSMSNLALLYHNQGEYGKALPLYVECLRKRNEVLGENHPDTLTSMNNLALLYHTQGEYEKASPIFEECLRKTKVVLGENHPDTLTSMNNLAVLYHTRGEYEKALPLYEECLRKRKVVLGESHPSTLTSMNNLALLYHTQGESGKALPLFEECLRKTKVVLGESHPYTLAYLNNLAGLYKGQGEYGKALPLYEESLQKRKVVLGENHPDTLTSMNNLALLYHNQGEHEKSVSGREEEDNKH